MKTGHLTSLSLLDRLQQPDNKQDWESFFSIYRPLIRQHLLGSGIRQSDIDDLLQESLTDMYMALPKFQHNGNVGAFRKWMKTIVVRKAYRALEHHQKLKSAQTQLGQLIEQFENSFEQMMNRDHDEHVVNSLLKMIRSEFTETTWVAFEMQVLEGKNASDVAQLLGKTTNATLISKSRVMRRLRELAKGIVEC